MGVSGQRHAPATLYPRERPGTHCIGEAGWVPGPIWAVAEKLAPTGIRSPYRPARSELVKYILYRIAHLLLMIEFVIQNTLT